MSDFESWTLNRRNSAKTEPFLPIQHSFESTHLCHLSARFLFRHTRSQAFWTQKYRRGRFEVVYFCGLLLLSGMSPTA
ncbi:hypothetical protein Y032_0716g1782 [Ancylostoma ceylanicum]|uniref:Uncharacterized protein n=1 Tax=Ancylostoma ceylanicum TaxID=53326 RepID=A0A016WFL9_9BILA|nr:hypothetical protein Y032_0716g1782 [Ancylostoma ceylanicum]